MGGGGGMRSFFLPYIAILFPLLFTALVARFMNPKLISLPPINERGWGTIEGNSNDRKNWKLKTVALLAG